MSAERVETLAAYAARLLAGTGLRASQAGAVAAGERPCTSPVGAVLRAGYESEELL